MLQKVFAVFLSLFFLPGCVSSSAQISSGAFGGPLSTESSQSFTESRVAEGTVEDASMNSLLICTDSGERLRFSTENAQMDLGKSGLLLGQRVEVTYLPAQQDVAAAISVRLLSEENSLGDEQLKNILYSMTLEEKVAQMFWVRCPEQGAVQAVSDWQIGGFILFGRDFAEKTPETFRQVVDEYQKNAKIPLLIGTDEEGGEVVRASRYRQFRASAFPSPQQLYAQGGMESILSDAADKSAFLLDLGINVNLAPVCDLSINPADYIYSRTLGKDAQATASYVAAVVQQMQQSGIGAFSNTFPAMAPTEIPIWDSSGMTARWKPFGMRIGFLFRRELQPALPAFWSAIPSSAAWTTLCPLLCRLPCTACCGMTGGLMELS